MQSMIQKTYYDNATKIWSGPKRNYLYSKNVTIGEVVLNALDKDPNKIGQISDNNGIEMTNREIRLKTIRAAQHLQKLNVKQNECFLFYTKNSHNLAPIVFGTWTVGAIVNGLDSYFKKDEMLYMCRFTKPSLIFCDADNYKIVEEAVKELSSVRDVYIVDGTVDGVKNIEEFFIETGTENEFLPPTIDDAMNHCAAIIYTSGTTGLPKGVCISHASLLHKPNIISTCTDDVLLCFATIYWITGLVSMLSSTVFGMKRIISTERFSPSLIIDLVEKHKVTTTLTAPFILGMLLQHPRIKTADLTSVKYLLCGGSSLHLEIIKQLKIYLPNAQIFTGYGCTEIAGSVTGNYPNTRDPSVGQVVPDIEIRIVDDNNRLCGPNESGEVQVRSAYNFLRYIGNEKATQEARTSDGFVLTGDIGRFDDDGYLYLIDRKKEIIKYKNMQIPPMELENLIISLNGISAVCVTGIPHKGHGDLPTAIVVKSKDSTVTADDVMAIVKENLVDEKQLRGGVYFMDTLPITPTGKISRGLVKKFALEMYAKNNVQPKDE